MTFIRLTLRSGNSTYVNPSLILQINKSTKEDGAGSLIFMVGDVAPECQGLPVLENPREILALLAQPVAVTVTDAMVEAALDKFCDFEWRNSQFVKRWIVDCRAAIEAALAVRAP